MSLSIVNDMLCNTHSVGFESAIVCSHVYRDAIVHLIEMFCGIRLPQSVYYEAIITEKTLLHWYLDPSIEFPSRDIKIAKNISVYADNTHILRQLHSAGIPASCCECFKNKYTHQAVYENGQVNIMPFGTDTDKNHIDEFIKENGTLMGLSNTKTPITVKVTLGNVTIECPLFEGRVLLPSAYLDMALMKKSE